MKIWRYKVWLTRTSAGGRSSRSVAYLAGAAAAVALLATVATSASAGNPASLNVTLSTVSQAVKSVTVSPVGINYSQCVYGSSSGSNLGFPNGACLTPIPGVAVQNGNTPATILVNGADMVPSDAGTHWTLCVFTVNCSGPFSFGGNPLPGPDQYYESLNAAGGYNTQPQTGQGPFLGLTTTAACDSILSPNPGCPQSMPGQQKTEFPAITGPSSSSDPSTTWTTSIVWTAT
jgi:hypothetical protein